MGKTMAFKIDIDWTPETITLAVDTWKRIIEAAQGGVRSGYTYPQSGDVSEAWITALSLSEGLGVHDTYGRRVWEPISVTLMSYGHHHGSCLDAANVRALADTPGVTTSTGDRDGGGSATMEVGELPGDDSNDLDTRLGWLVAVADMVEGLESDYPLIDDGAHSEYVNELAENAWDSWLGSDVCDAVAEKLTERLRVDEAYAARLRERYGYMLDDDCINDDQYVAEMVVAEMVVAVRTVYYGFEENEWNCDGATDVRNGRHDEAVVHVYETVFVKQA